MCLSNKAIQWPFITCVSSSSQLEKQCKELYDDKHETKVENTRLKLTNQELHKDVDRTSEELIIAQQQLQILQEEAKKLQEEKEM